LLYLIIQKKILIAGRENFFQNDKNKIFLSSIFIADFAETITVVDLNP
jgi:hypothetical protein